MYVEPRSSCVRGPRAPRIIRSTAAAGIESRRLCNSLLGYRTTRLRFRRPLHLRLGQGEPGDVELLYLDAALARCLKRGSPPVRGMWADSLIALHLNVDDAPQLGGLARDSAGLRMM